MIGIGVATSSANPANARGRFDPSNGSFHTGEFLVDRSGMFETQGRSFKPVTDPEATVKALCAGKWPE